MSSCDCSGRALQKPQHYLQNSFTERKKFTLRVKKKLVCYKIILDTTLIILILSIRTSHRWTQPTSDFKLQAISFGPRISLCPAVRFPRWQGIVCGWKQRQESNTGHRARSEAYSTKACWTKRRQRRQKKACYRDKRRGRGLRRTAIQYVT